MVRHGACFISSWIEICYLVTASKTIRVQDEMKLEFCQSDNCTVHASSSPISLSAEQGELGNEDTLQIMVPPLLHCLH